VDSLDDALLSALKGDKDCWFQNPYGASAFFPNVTTCLECLRKIVADLSKAGAVISVGVAWGNFGRNHAVVSWSAVAHAINTAARLASIESVRRNVAVDRKVREDLIRSGTPSTFFGAERADRVKGAGFRYFLLTDPSMQGESPPPSKIEPPNTLSITLANIVSFDIEKYSRKSEPEQAKLTDELFWGVDHSLERIGKKPESSWTPAGDGGQLVFLSDEGRSAPQAWQFAQFLLERASEKELPLRIGIAHGPVLKSKHRASVGGALLRADQISSETKAYGIAVSEDFWKGLADEFKTGVKVARPATDSSVLLTFPKPLVNLHREKYAWVPVVLIASAVTLLVGLAFRSWNEEARLNLPGYIVVFVFCFVIAAIVRWLWGRRR
jgi:class 3 adenylate cyclase